MKQSVLFVLFTFFSLTSFSQKQANIWYFGTLDGVDFNSGSPVSISNGALSTNEGCASIADKKTGRSLFYTDGITVYDSTNLTMLNGTGLLGNATTTQSAVIIPEPGSDSLFYIFTQDPQAGYVTGNAGVFCYSIVDMSQNGGLGAVTSLNNVLIDSMEEKIAAYPACNGIDIWVVSHQWDSNAFYAYLVSNGGVSAPVISNAGAIHTDVSGAAVSSLGYMKISPDGTMIGVACDRFMHLVEVFPFNNVTGVVGPTPILTDSASWLENPSFAGPYGLTFSPDCRLLYASVEGGGAGGGVFQYNLKAGNNAVILATKIAVGVRPLGYGIGALQIGPDGKIYMAETETAALGVINYPNTPGLGCNFVAEAIPLSGNCNFGLPDFVESFLVPHFKYTTTMSYVGCSGNGTIAFADSNLNGNITSIWNFGDSLSGSADSSTLKSPAHLFSSSGNYTVTLILTNGCRTDTLTQAVNILSANDSVTISLSDTAFCFGGSVQLQASGGSNYKWSPGIGLSDSTIANPIAMPFVTTTYTVSSSLTCGGDSAATVSITVYPDPPTPVIEQLHDTLFFQSDPAYISSQWYDDTTLIPGATDTILIISHAGNYNVKVTNANGCSIAVGVNINIGVHNFSPDDYISLFPNPASDQLIIESSFSYGDKAVTVSVINVLGEIILEEKIKWSRETVLNIKQLSAGIYFLQFKSEQGDVVRKFIKE